MEWWLFLILFFGGLLLIMSIGLPIAFSFFFVNIVFVVVSFGFERGLSQLIGNSADSLIKFTLTPIPLFILMGEFIFRSGIISDALNAFSKCLGKIPGRLTLLTLGGGTLFSNLSGSAIANTALLGSTLIPEMKNYKYKNPMIFGPIMGAAGLAIVIPPSNIAVLLGSIGKISVGPLLIAGVIPGLIMASFYVIYVIIRCKINPSLAPVYETATYSLSDKIFSVIKYILPLGFIIFVVLGFILIGVTTPTEAAAMGALGAFLLVVCYGRLSMKVMKEAIKGTLHTTGMIMLIIAGASAFSQLLSLTGATRAIIDLVANLSVSPMMLLICMLLIVFIMGMFLEQIAIMMLVLPLFVPIITALGFDPIWFGVLMLITMEIGTFSPPFGMILFVMKGIVPPGTTMIDLYKSAIPFVLINIVVVAVIIIWPQLALWLPSLTDS